MTTPKGVHCPTAVVQQIQDFSTHELRAPQLGEQEFKQCQCAETTRLKKQSSQEQAAFAALPTLNLPTYLGSEFWIPLFPNVVIPTHQKLLLLEPVSQPATPPPNFI